MNYSGYTVLHKRQCKLKLLTVPYNGFLEESTFIQFLDAFAGAACVV
jgi:hypothetical protein